MILVGGMLGLFLFFPLCIKILKKESVQNPLTYFLWGSLDAIFAGAAYKEGGNYLQAVLFACGGLATASCILYAGGKLAWTKFETLVTTMAVLCIVIWVLTTNVLAASASIAALTIASIPQIVDTWKKPQNTPTLIYLGYTVSNLLSALGGKEFSVIEVGYAVGGLVVCSIITVFSLQKEK